MHDYEIKINRVEDGVIWIRLEKDGKPVFETPIASCIREYVDVDYQAALKGGTGFQPEVALKKVRLSKAFDKELLRA